MVTTYSPMIGQFFDTMMGASSEKLVETVYSHLNGGKIKYNRKVIGPLITGRQLRVAVLIGV